LFDIIAKLTDAFGVSGNEEEIRNLLINETKDYIDDYKIDNMGNLTLIKKGKNKKIMLAAHMDEIGVIITHIDKNGYLRFSNLGGVNKFIAIGQRVKFQNGVVGTVYYENKVKRISELDYQRMFIDIGANTKEEAENNVKVGDAAVFVGKAKRIKDTVISKALDDRIGCSILFELIRRNIKSENEIYYTFTVQEEVGLRGAKTAAFDLQPDLAIVIDVTLTGDTPESDIMEVKLGKGPAIKIKDRSVISHPIVKNLLIDTAKKHNIPYQFEILEMGGTDTGAILLTRGGIIAGAVSVPCRYVHSPSEMISLNDVKNIVKLLENIIIEVK
jgi:endoglucanase